MKWHGTKTINWWILFYPDIESIVVNSRVKCWEWDDTTQRWNGSVWMCLYKGIGVLETLTWFGLSSKLYKYFCTLSTTGQSIQLLFRFNLMFRGCLNTNSTQKERKQQKHEHNTRITLTVPFLDWYVKSTNQKTRKINSKKRKK